MTGRLPDAIAGWPKRRRQALADGTMRAAVVRTTKNLVAGKTTAFATYPYGEELRVRAVAARRASVGRIDELLEQLVANVRANGGYVTRAAAPDDVGRYIVEIARRRGAARVVKSKSMATEEVALNHQLEAAGLKVRETDLGEYIVQLAGEPPAHILAPAAHKTRGQVRELFEREAVQNAVAGPADDATPSLTAFARRQLREDFLGAEIGVTGGNFLVAETGTLALITNEGNGRLTSSLPPVLVAVVGIDKVVATWDDLCVLIQQPPLNGTGQLISTYVSLITGPRRPGELDGPEEFHLILLDNGRHDLLGTEYEDVLTCIRCGACLNVCPVFRNIGGQAYGSMYSGPIGVVLTPLLGGLERAPELPKSACTMCHACRPACPMEIELPHHILSLRRMETEAAIGSRMDRLTFRLWGRLWASPAGYRLTARAARLGQWLFMRRGKLTRAPGLMGGWTASRDAPPVAGQTFQEWWRRRPRPGGRA